MEEYVYVFQHTYVAYTANANKIQTIVFIAVKTRRLYVYLDSGKFQTFSFGVAYFVKAYLLLENEEHQQ